MDRASGRAKVSVLSLEFYSKARAIKPEVIKFLLNGSDRQSARNRQNFIFRDYQLCQDDKI